MAKSNKNAKRNAKHGAGNRKTTDYSSNTSLEKKGNGVTREDSNNSKYKGKMYNDPSWRKLGSILADQSNAYPLDHIAGTPFPIQPYYPLDNQTKYAVTPHDIITVFINPSFGISTDRNSAINLAAFKLYTQLSSNNNKTTLYQPNDLALILGALGDVISLASFIRRAIGMAGTISATNYAYPKSVVEAMGIEYDDLIRNIANYRTQYNITANLASSILFPADLNYFKTCDALYKDIFLDHSTTRAQTYVTRPRTVWKYDDHTYPSGGALITYNPFSTLDGWTVSLASLIDALRDMIEELKGTALLQNVYADVLKLYGGDMAKVFSLPLVPTDYAIAPVYSEEWMLGLENAVIYSGVGHESEDLYADSEKTQIIGTARNNVYSDANHGTIIYAPYLKSSYLTKLWTDKNKVDITPFVSPNVNFHVDNPNVDDRVTAVRWMAPCVRKESTYYGEGVTDSSKDPIYQFAFSDHYISKMMYRTASGNAPVITSDADMLKDYEGELAIYAHPRRMVVGAMVVADGTNDFTMRPNYIFAEWDVMTHVQDVTLKTINECTLLALFNY